MLGPDQVVANLTGEGLASNVVYKEMFLTLRDTQHLHSEQKVRPPRRALRRSL